MIGSRGAGVASGMLAALALPPFHLWPLAFVALVPLTLALSDPGTSRARASESGLLFGAVFYGTLLHWVPPTMHGMVPLGALSGVMMLAVLAGIGGVQAVALRALLVHRAAPPFLAVPAVWVTTEFVLAHAGPLAYPWTPLALALAPAPELAGVGEWIGPRGLTFWIAAVNGAVVFLQRRESGRRTWVAAALTLILLLGPASWGVWRAATLPVHALPSVALIHMDLSRQVLLDPVARDRDATAALRRILDGALDRVPRTGEGAPVLAILPEAPFSSAWDAEREADMRGYAEALDIPLLIGSHVSVDRLEDSGRADALWNAILVVPPDGEVARAHAKVRLVPGVERPGLAVGPDLDARSVAGVRLGFLICFEAAFDRQSRLLARQHLDLLVNPSNDGWFTGGLVPWSGAGLAQHRAHLVLRALETRRGAVRASLGGETLVVSPTGRIDLRRSAGDEGLLMARPRTSRISAGFVRWGDLAGPIGVLVLLGLVFRPHRGEPSVRRMIIE